MAYGAQTHSPRAVSQTAVATITAAIRRARPRVGLLSLTLLLAPIPTLAQTSPSTDGEMLSQRDELRIEAFRFEGNRVIGDATLQAIAAPWRDRPVTLNELFTLKERITGHYVEQGYINSGARIPDQRLNQGQLLIEITEGRLSQLRIAGNDRLREGYLRPRIAPDEEDAPLNMLALRERLKLIEESRLVAWVDAHLAPGLRPGEAELDVEIGEASPWHIAASIDNHRPPSVGALRGRLEIGHLNLSGWGDALTARYDLSDGTDNYAIDYSLPLSRHDTTLSLHYERTDSLVVEPPFDILDFSSESEIASLRLRHPLIRGLSREVALGLGLNVTETRTWLGGDPFAFPPSPAQSKSTVLSLTQEWIERSPQRVIAAYASLDFGMDWLDATDRRGEIGIDGAPTRPSDRADGLFIAWTGQLQWMEKLDLWESHLLMRLNLRWANDALLAHNRFAIGGAGSVRGYRENSLIRDGGVTASLEWRTPIARLAIPGISKTEVDGRISLIPFFDYGYGRNAQGLTPRPDDIASIGLGVRWQPSPKVRAELFWGHPLKELETVGEHDLQDDGIHFSLTTRW